MAKVNLSPPWVEYYKEVSEFFRDDQEIGVLYDESKNELRIYVDNPDRAVALAELFPLEKNFGNVKLYISIIPSNKKVNNNKLKAAYPSTVAAALANCPAVDSIKEVKTFFDMDLTYVLFKNKVVQYFIDNIGDYNGMRSILYEDIARNILEDVDGVFFCTALPNNSSSYIINPIKMPESNTIYCNCK